MSQPKKRISTARRNSRRYSHGNKVPTVTASICPNCNEPKRPHSVCKCGYYNREKKVLTVKEKSEPVTA